MDELVERPNFHRENSTLPNDLIVPGKDGGSPSMKLAFNYLEELNFCYLFPKLKNEERFGSLSGSP